MFSLNSLLGTVWKLAGQFPDEYGRIGNAEESSVAKLGPAPSNISMAGIWIPKDVIHLIFRHLSPEQLPKICSVCKVFNEVASSNPLWNSYDLKNVFPNATFIDRAVWEAHIDVNKYGLTFQELTRPCVDKRGYMELKQIESQVEDGRGITIITLPKGARLNHVRDFAAPKAGNPTVFQYFSDNLVRDLGEGEVEEGTVAMTNGILIGTRNDVSAEQIKIAEGLKCEAPGIFVATCIGVVRQMMSPQGAPVRLLSDNRQTFTLCVDNKTDKRTGEIVKVISHFGDDAAGPVAAPNTSIGEGYGLAGLWRRFGGLVL